MTGIVAEVTELPLDQIDRGIEAETRHEMSPELIGAIAEITEDGDTIERIKEHVAKIHELTEHRLKHSLEIGRELRALRDDCFDGAKGKNAAIWGKFLTDEFEWGKSTAYNFISAAKIVDGFPIIGKLRPTAIYALASPGTPEAAVEEVAKRLENGEKLSGKEIAAIIDAHKAAQPLKGKKAEEGKEQTGEERAFLDWAKQARNLIAALGDEEPDAEVIEAAEGVNSILTEWLRGVGERDEAKSRISEAAS